MSTVYKAIRVGQVLLLLGAAVTGLSWFEQARGDSTQEIGEERVALQTRAPVQNPQGPWGEDQVFTEAHAGVPTKVAPMLNVSARHVADGLPARDHAWSAELTLEATGDSGGTWWSQTRPVALNATGDEAYVELDLPRIVKEGRSMAAATELPSRLSITLAIDHEATVVVDGEPRATSHRSTLDLVPREGFVVPRTQEDGTTYAQPVEDEIDRVPIALAGAAVLAEGGALGIRRRREPWESAWGVDAVEVDGLEVDPSAATVELDALLRQARDRGSAVFVDRAAGRALAPGDPPLVARVDADDEAGRAALPGRPPLPGA